MTSNPGHPPPPPRPAPEGGEPLFQRASDEIHAKNWEEAAPLFTELATALEHEGRPEAAHGAWAAAGDAAWRGDRPILAVRSLFRAIDLARTTPTMIATRQVQLAAAFMDLGDPESAASFLDDAATALERAEAHGNTEVTRRIRVLLHDGQIALLLMTGLVRSASEVLEILRAEVQEGEELVAWFRAGQIQRIQGRFSAAVESLSACAFQCRADPRFDGPLGASLLEMAEIALLCDHSEDALLLLDEAEQAWARAGRRSGVFRVEAMRMKVMTRTEGCAALPTGLQRAIEYAEEREMKVLEAELRLARGLSLLQPHPQAAEDELGRTILLAKHAAMPHLAGQARLALHGRPGGRLGALEQAVQELEESPPWLARAFVALARHMSVHPRQVGRAMELCGLALCRFGEMGMTADELAARRLLQEMADGE